MYFSKNKKSLFLKKLRHEGFSVYEIKLYGGDADDEADLKWLIDRMFSAWRTIICSRNRGYVRQFRGIMRRLFVEFDKAAGVYRPYFHLLCIRERNPGMSDDDWRLMLGEEKLRVQTYIKWLSAWASALKLCTDVRVDFSLVELERIETVLGSFFTNEKYSAFVLLDDMKRQVIRRSCGVHHLVSFHGIFKEMNRQVSVER
ncbi:MAG: hypothetical protein IJ530_01155 [Treponema sp.]|uniref:hypothetical protein n=1 Tax=Treponema sp. TaxID=166 RepID=UPI0025F445FB|nr:hypothetical protein [Treponema sp.]MBQ8678353.1 hypothetical protein [Treponema sp.]